MFDAQFCITFKLIFNAAYLDVLGFKDAVFDRNILEDLVMDKHD